jgi:excisionase family DNA binding protein
MSIIDDDPIITTRDAAQLLGVAISTAQLWMESGALPAWKTPGGHRRVRLSAVMQLRRKRSGDAEATPGQSDQEGMEGPQAPSPAALMLLDSPPEEAFDRLVRLAAQVSACPVALVTILDTQRQWFKARVGIDLAETPRAWSFCSHALAEGGELVVGDALEDPRFAANPLVTGAPRLRFYAGVALEDAQGRRIGALCVLDREPRRLRGREMQALRELAAIASDEIKRRA